MSKINDAKKILKDLGLPPAQQNDTSALTLLALCNLKERGSWGKTKQVSMRVTKEIMAFVNENYRVDKHYASNTRETFRKDVLHQFIQAGIIDYNPDRELPTNSPNAHYALTGEALEAIKCFGSDKWDTAVKRFKRKKGNLVEQYSKERHKTLSPLTLESGEEIRLSVGKHNQVEIAVVKEFAPRFATGGKVLYIGDTAKKDIYSNVEALEELGIKLDMHSKLPDVIIYVKSKNWLYLIEAVTSRGPVSPKRLIELEKLFNDCKAGKVYVSAFPDFKEFKKHMSNIAWETEVWVAENPSHLIHFNGDRFLGPR